MAVTTEHRGAVTTIILDRVERRNAIDSPTAKALRAAFRTFERNREARVAVLWGANGTFCAGADLKAYAERRQRRPWPVYDEGPMGPTRIRLAKPAIAAVALALPGPDPVTTMLELLPMWALFEGSIWLAVFAERRAARLAIAGTPA